MANNLPSTGVGVSGDTVNFSLNGLEDVLARIDSLKIDVRMKGGRFALRKAAQVIQRQAIENAKRLDDPATPESIEKNVAVRWSGKRFRQNGDLMFRVGILGGARQYANTKENVRAGRAGKSYATLGDKSNPGGDTWYWRFLEFGSEHAPARPFLRPAAQQAAGAAVDEFVAQYSRAIDRAIRRSTKKLTRQG
ncbi:HK97-gp10 family putative phage morphogenesis protein [Stutzerimonas nitrititolerans]|uniref:HK97-gp10 family putative phage morphogenesis protein n=1 Tax=Stutzerimonas nitrititolerans TaxID=2482751 RepID=UPI00289A5C67|nr:HK97-gp10 family putative phage morphogenesis protein [Stutzerimonas nitrititolerans]